MLRRLGLVALVLCALAGFGGVWWWRTHDLGPVQRGYRLAVENGCLSCHGPAGRGVDPDGQRGVGEIPAFEQEDVRSRARDRREIREWILDGKPRRLAEEPGGERAPLLRMPSWRGRLGEREVDDLVAYVAAVSDFDPVPESAAAGRAAAAALGCFACHGPAGRGDTPNPGSLKGHVPSWTGNDFAELARDDGEIREWVRDGAPRRLRENRVAAFFLGRQAIRMPAFGETASDEEIRKITAYIRWLRRPAPQARD